MTVEEVVAAARLGRSTVFKAMNPNPAYRAGIPFLPSVRIGRARRSRAAAFQAWLAALEQANAATDAA